MLVASRLSLLILAATVVSRPVLAEDYDELDERLQVVEERLAKTTTQGGGGLLGMVADFQRLQEEVRSLRGDVERLQFEAEQNRQRQREMFLDIEKRLAAMEKGQRGIPPGAAVRPAMPPLTPGITPTDVLPTTEDAPTVEAGTTDSGATEGEGAETGSVVGDMPQPTLTEQDAYLKAFELLKQGRYDDSVSAFSGFLNQFPAGNYADNARYWLAETYYVKKNYPTALEQFQLLLKEHPDSSKLPGALLKIGYIQYELGNNPEARASLERVRVEFSDSSVAALAKQRLERMDREGR